VVVEEGRQARLETTGDVASVVVERAPASRGDWGASASERLETTAAVVEEGRRTRAPVVEERRQAHASVAEVGRQAARVVVEEGR